MDPTKLPFHYQKSNSFRVVHVDGAYGGLTPQLNIFLSMYADRLPIPQMLVYNIDENGRLANEIPTERVSKEGIVREVEVGLVMSVDAAKSLVTFLQEKIEHADSVRKLRTQVENK